VKKRPGAFVLLRDEGNSRNRSLPPSSESKEGMAEGAGEWKVRTEKREALGDNAKGQGSSVM